MGIMLKAASLKTTQSFVNSLTSFKTLKTANPLDKKRALRAERLVLAASFHGIYPGSCLHRALVLFLLLRLDGIFCELKIGLGRISENYSGHAWVETNDLKLLTSNPNEQEAYAELTPFKL